MTKLFNKEEVLKIREDYLLGAAQNQLAKKYKVHPKLIYNIIHGLTYTDDSFFPKYYQQRLLVRRKKNKNKKIKYPVILIGHKKRQGKDTFATYLAEELLKNKVKVKKHAFANNLKSIIADAFKLTVEELEILKNNEEMVENDYTKISYREILQRFGTNKMKELFGKTVWVDLVKKEFIQDGVNIITDFRFPEEVIKGAFTIKVERTDTGDNHKSETALDNFKFDYVVDNTKDLDNLREEAKKVASLIV